MSCPGREHNDNQEANKEFALMCTSPRRSSGVRGCVRHYCMVVDCRTLLAEHIDLSAEVELERRRACTPAAAVISYALVMMLVRGRWGVEVSASTRDRAGCCRSLVAQKTEGVRRCTDSEDAPAVHQLEMLGAAHGPDALGSWEDAHMEGSRVGMVFATVLNRLCLSWDIGQNGCDTRTSGARLSDR